MLTSLYAQTLSIVSGPTVTYLSDTSAMLMVIVSNATTNTDGESQAIRTFKELDDYLFNLALENKLDEFHYNKKDIEFVNGFGTINIKLSKSKNNIATVAQPVTGLKVAINSGFMYPLGATSKKASKQIIHQMNKQQPRAVIWMGNTLYYPLEDAGKDEQQFMKNINFRQEEPIKQLFRNSGHLAIWNDRDFAPENWDNALPDPIKAEKLFKQFWPVPEFNTAKAGIYKNTRMEDAEFFLLDHLYFRESSTPKLGAHQLFWLKEQLYKSTANFKFIVSGTSFLQTDASVAQLEEKEEILNFIRNHKINGVVFLSSALPYTELSIQKSEDFYPLHEFSCAVMTDLGLPIPTAKNSMRVNKTLSKKANFGMVTIKEENEQRFCWLETYDQNGGLLWTFPINLKSLQK